jgi:glyoxylase-like metal-dependent hydrolase (beta-lactamase superfamily II)
MKLLADELYQLKYFPPNAINVYLMGTVLVDAATRRDGKRILRQIEGREVTAHALTHAHGDHQGASREVCQKLGVPYWAGERDVEAAEGGAEAIGARMPDHFMPKLSRRAFAGPGHPVDRALHEGDEVGAGFSVIDTPGHSAGHVAYWRESDRTLILGDVLFNQHPLLGIPGLRQPPDFFTPDPAQNRDSARKLAALEPALVCFGHGPPLRDTSKFVQFVESLPRE